ECDDGDTNDHNGCSNACTMPSCNNGIVDQGEDCDLGAGMNGLTTACPACHPATCGDNHTETGVEDCDPGTPNTDVAGCNRNCTMPACGDGIRNAQFKPD